jgi:hypothetical protein
MMNDKVNIELQEIMLAQLLDHAMVGIKETGEYTPMLAWTFKQLAEKLPDSAWNAETIKEFAASLDDTIDDGDEDYSFTLDPLYDEDDY